MTNKIRMETLGIAGHTPADVSAKCAMARELENAGDYEGARETLADIWRGIGQRPDIEGLSPKDGAEMLLRAGTISGWLGTSGQIPGAQEFAKDLISESIRAFERLADRDKLAEAQTDLAICYWREGAIDEARVWFSEALTRASAPTNQFRVLINSTIVEVSSNRFADALVLLDRAAPLLDEIEDPAVEARYHSQRAIVLMKLGGTDNLDKALIESAAASAYFERAGHKRYYARVENNTAIALLDLGRLDDALEHVERACRTVRDLGDVGTLAIFNETRSRVFLAQGRYEEAEKTAFTAAGALERGGEQSLLAEALTTQGTGLARMNRHDLAFSVLQRAAQVAEIAGDPELSGRTLLTIVEELRSVLSPDQLGSFYRQADERLGNELSPDTANRLRAAARLIASHAGAMGAIPPMAGDSLEQEVLKFEGEWIRRALDKAQGSVTRAARDLGLTHQGLCYIINTRHKSLLDSRAPVRVRRKSIMKKPLARKAATTS